MPAPARSTPKLVELLPNRNNHGHTLPRSVRAFQSLHRSDHARAPNAHWPAASSTFDGRKRSGTRRSSRNWLQAWRSSYLALASVALAEQSVTNEYKKGETRGGEMTAKQTATSQTSRERWSRERQNREALAQRVRLDAVNVLKKFRFVTNGGDQRRQCGQTIESNQRRPVKGGDNNRRTRRARR